MNKELDYIRVYSIVSCSLWRRWSVSYVTMIHDISYGWAAVISSSVCGVAVPYEMTYVIAHSVNTTCAVSLWNRSSTDN